MVKSNCKVNDRGPFQGNRLIDLSYAAAKTLGWKIMALQKLRSAIDLGGVISAPILIAKMLNQQHLNPKPKYLLPSFTSPP